MGRLRGVAVIAVVWIGRAALGAPDAGTALDPKVANPGSADAPSEIIRDGFDAGVEDDVPGTVFAGVETDGGSNAEVRPQPPTVPAKAVPDLVAGNETDDDSEIAAGLSASARVSVQGVTPFLVDETERVGLATLMTRLRVAPTLRWRQFEVVAETDAATGAVAGALPASFVSDRVPFPALRALDLRKLSVAYQFESGSFRVGLQTLSWGLGMLWNDGSRDSRPGEFGQQQYGNTSHRAVLSVRPFHRESGAARLLEASVAADLINRDTHAEFARGDRAFQGLLAIRFLDDAGSSFGLFVASRTQRNVLLEDAPTSDVVMLDVTGTWVFKPLTVSFEAALISGATSRMTDLRTTQVRVQQAGAAVKASYRFGRLSLLADWGLASDDSNDFDDRSTRFRMDRDFKVGLILFDHLLAYQSARTQVRLGGRPQNGETWRETLGSVTGAWYLFPRATFALTPAWHVFGGPLFAFSTLPRTDSANSQGSGEPPPMSAFRGPSSGYLGTELDLGTQVSVRPIPQIEFTVTGEVGILWPGDAFVRRLMAVATEVAAPAYFGRVRCAVSL
jgi:hypothetical protein